MKHLKFVIGTLGIFTIWYILFKIVLNPNFPTHLIIMATITTTFMSLKGVGYGTFHYLIRGTK